MGTNECSRSRDLDVQVCTYEVFDMNHFRRVVNKVMYGVNNHENAFAIKVTCLCSRLADIMEKHKEELATIESLDAGAVYTLALKTHVGMSIDTFRYYAGWCDKIQVGAFI